MIIIYIILTVFGIFQLVGTFAAIVSLFGGDEHENMIDMFIQSEPKDFAKRGVLFITSIPIYIIFKISAYRYMLHVENDICENCIHRRLDKPGEN